MDFKKRILKRQGGYFDWYGRPATETQYLDYLRAQGVKDVYLDVQESADAQIAKFDAKKLQAQTEETWLYVEIRETDIPQRAALLNHLGQDATLGNLPGNKKGLQKVPGIGPVAAQKISQWMNDNWEVNIP